MSALPAPPDVVESYLLALMADPRNHEVSLKFRARAREREFGLRACGVDELLVNEFLHQNIVDEVRILGPGSEPRDVRDLLAFLLFQKQTASEIVQPALLAKLDECTRAVLEERRVLLEVLPVYGASVLLLAQSIEWLE